MTTAERPVKAETIEAIAFLESTRPADRWGNRTRRTHQGKGGGHVPQLWTREVCLEFLRRHIRSTRGRLPAGQAYLDVKKGQNLPPESRLIDLFGSVNTAWLEAGASRRRVGLLRWTDEEDEFLRDNAGTMSRKQLAAALKRSEGSVHRRLGDIGVSIRSNLGYVSASALAKSYNCPVKRVVELIEAGEIEASKPPHAANRWEIAPWLITNDVKFKLLEARVTQNNRREYTHQEVNLMISMREGGHTWFEIGRYLQRNYNSVRSRYEIAFTRRPLWRSLWYLAKEFGGAVALIDAVEILSKRGLRTNYSKLRAAASSQPKRLQLAGGTVSVITHWSKRVRPRQRVNGTA